MGGVTSHEPSGALLFSPGYTDCTQKRNKGWGRMGKGQKAL